MKHSALLLSALLLTASAFAQVQVLWDVPLNIPVTYDSSRYVRLFPDGKVLAWSYRSLAVFDTLGELQWQWNVPLTMGPAYILDARVQDGGLLVAMPQGVGLDSTYWSFVLTRFSLDGDSMDSHTLHTYDLAPVLGAIGTSQTTFASLTEMSLAPHGMLTAISNSGDSLWTIEVLPYTMDNVNSFTSLRETANHGWALTGTYGWPGDGRNALSTVSSAGQITGGGSMGSVTEWRLFDALEDGSGHLWVMGIQDANVARMLKLYCYPSSSPWVSRPLAQGWEYFGENALIATPDSGMLLAGHVGGYNAANRVFLMRLNNEVDTLWTTTLPLYNRFTDVATSPEGGYLALAIDYSAASYHLVRFIETTAGTDKGAVLLPASYSLSAYPNPFNPSTNLSFTVPESEKISLRIYDLLGQEVAPLFEGTVTAGTHSFSWNAKDQSAGVYFARLQSGKRALTQKLLLLK